MKHHIGLAAIVLTAVAAPVGASMLVSYQNETTGLYCGDGHEGSNHWTMKGYVIGTDEWQATFLDTTYEGVLAQCVEWADQN
jgi:hypothetical protein